MLEENRAVRASYWGQGRYLSRSLGAAPRWFQESVPNNPHSISQTQHSYNAGTILFDQARFQQKQQEMKEQSMVEMFQNAQAKTFNRLSPGNNPQIPLQTQPGKVRMMFEERRSKAGIDKSYPLQPLSNGTSIKNVSNSNKNGVHSYKSSTIHNDGDRTVRQDVNVEIKRSNPGNPVSKNNVRRIEIVTKTFKDLNLNNEENIDDVTFDFPDFVDLPPAKLPNVGGSLPSQKKLGELKVNGAKKPTPPPVQKVAPRVQRPTPPKTLKTVATSSPNIRPSQSPMTPMKAATPTRNFAASPKTPSKPNVESVAKPRSPPTPSGPVPEGCCRVCRRKFAPDRLPKHETICVKTSTKKRKQYDALKHRVAGTEVETYVKHVRKGAAKPPPKPVVQATGKKDWRKTHEEFINAIRAAKQVQAHIKKGGKLSDLPPPPPSDTSDYISCPHCSRRFNQGAAERHIPKCANFQFNKPKPVSKKR